MVKFLGPPTKGYSKPLEHRQPRRNNFNHSHPTVYWGSYLPRSDLSSRNKCARPSPQLVTHVRISEPGNKGHCPPPKRRRRGQCIRHAWKATRVEGLDFGPNQVQIWVLSITSCVTLNKILDLCKSVCPAARWEL